MENFILNAVVHELTTLINKFKNFRLGKICTIGNSFLTLDLRLGDGRILYISTVPNDGRFYFTSRRVELSSDKPVSDSPFVQKIRKELNGASLISIYKPEFDRSITLGFINYDSNNNHQTTLLQLDLTGQSSNLYWLNSDGIILEMFHLNRSRLLTVGSIHQTFLSTEKEYFNFQEISEELINSKLDNSSLDVVENFFRTQVSNCSSTIATEIRTRAGIQSTWEAFSSVKNDLENSSEALLYSKQNLNSLDFSKFNAKKDLKISTFPLQQCKGWSLYKFQNISEALDKYFYLKDEQIKFLQNKQRWQSSLVLLNKRLTSAQFKIENTEASDEKIEQWKHYGDLIYANLKTGKRTATGLEAINYYLPENETIEIPIPEGLSLTAAAQQYLQKYQKYQRSKITNDERKEKLFEKTTQIQVVLDKLIQCGNIDELDQTTIEIQKILPPELQPKSKNEKKKSKDSKSNEWHGLRRYKGPEGYEIFVGRTAKDNDRLTFKLSRSFDIWLHTADYPGSHVLIRRPTRAMVPHKVIIAAAELAAFFSSVKSENKVNVHYTERKYLSRPRNSTPGSVLFTQAKTIIVTPQEILERIY